MRTNIKDNKTKITVANIPSYIICYCPHCGEQIKIPHSDFLGMMREYYYGDWVGDTFRCPECGEEIIEIKNVDWD